MTEVVRGHWPFFTEGRCRLCGEVGRKYWANALCISCKAALRRSKMQVVDLPQAIGRKAVRKATLNPRQWLTENFGKTYVDSLFPNLTHEEEFKPLQNHAFYIFRVWYRRWLGEDGIYLFDDENKPTVEDVVTAVTTSPMDLQEW